jgi:hypothetical protein
MRMVVVLVLLVFWCVLAFRAFQRGDMTIAVLYAVVGIVLTVWRLRRT